MQVNQLSNSLRQILLPLPGLDGRSPGETDATPRVDPMRSRAAVQDTVSFSPEALEAAGAARVGDAATAQAVEPPTEAGSARDGGTGDGGTGVGGNGDVGGSDAGAGGEQQGAPGAATELTPEERARVAELRQRDREVRAHENAHVAAGGSLVVGPPSFTFETGPDGRRYAVAGEVQVRGGSSSADPETRLRESEQIIRAALAPADPSGADRSVAASAAQEAATARAELGNANGRETGNSETAPNQPAAGGPDATATATAAGAPESATRSTFAPSTPGLSTSGTASTEATQGAPEDRVGPTTGAGRDAATAQAAYFAGGSGFLAAATPTTATQGTRVDLFA